MISGNVYVKTKWCKGCRLCTAFCPCGVLEVHREKCHVANPQNCIRCSLCEKVCPDYAIYFFKDGEKNE